MSAFELLITFLLHVMTVSVAIRKGLYKDLFKFSIGIWIIWLIFVTLLSVRAFRVEYPAVSMGIPCSNPLEFIKNILLVFGLYLAPELSLASVCIVFSIIKIKNGDK